MGREEPSEPGIKRQIFITSDRIDDLDPMLGVLAYVAPILSRAASRCTASKAV
jgi:hypothetical protein